MRNVQALSVLRYRDFRLLWTSTLLLFASQWTDVVAAGWLVLERTGSPFQVGLLGACRFAGWALTPLTGVIADRVDRRRLLLLAQALYAAPAAVLLVLIVTETLQVWHVFTAVLLRGMAFSLDYPTRNALLLDLVGKGDLLNAMGLNRAASYLTAVMGPILGGSFIASLGFDWVYSLITAFCVTNLGVLFWMRKVEAPVSSKAGSAWADLAEGWRQVRADRTVTAVLVMAALANLLAFPLAHAFMPVFARDVLNVGAGGLGFLTAAIGAGALAGSLSVAWLGGERREASLVRVSFVAWPLVMLGFAFSSQYHLSLALLLGVGVAEAISMVSSTTLLLRSVSDEMRGRVMGVRGLAVATLPFGNLLAGALIGRLGAPFTLMMYSAACVVLIVGMVSIAPGLRRWR